MIPKDFRIPDWHWGTPEGNRDFDRLLDRSLSFREVLESLEEMETLSLRFAANRSPQFNEAAARLRDGTL